MRRGNMIETNGGRSEAIEAGCAVWMLYVHMQRFDLGVQGLTSETLIFEGVQGSETLVDPRLRTARMVAHGLAFTGPGSRECPNLLCNI